MRGNLLPAHFSAAIGGTVGSAKKRRYQHFGISLNGAANRRCKERSDGIAIVAPAPIASIFRRHGCQQFVRPDIVDIWMGDSPERLVGRVYTHFSDDFMREQMTKVKFIT